MDQPLILHASAVKWRIARALADDHETPHHLGSVTLRPHQRDAVARLRRVIAESRGALLADAVGLGKTFVAIALARDAIRPLVVAPAALADMWHDALQRTSVRCHVTSYEKLSRRTNDPAINGTFDLLILDEAHHARTPSTRRYQRLANLATNARVLLLSATPVHNSRRDLASLLALFLGARAWQLPDDDLARFVIRRDAAESQTRLPQLDPPVWLPTDDDGSLLDEILDLPPPLPPSDGGDEGALLAWSLARQWSSSIGALLGGLRRRLARGAALDAALADGRHLSRESLASWACDEAATQLAFPQLFPAATYATAELRDRLRRHVDALQSLLRHARENHHADATRAQRLRDIRATHPGEKVVAFSQYADTVRALATHLRADRGIGTLTSRRATAGSRMTRSELLARFAPIAHHAPAPRDIERVDLLLTTDLLSEGVNLHDASVVVHIDLPWTPARLEQRVGRSRRLGATHSRTTVYALAPPAPAETLLRVETRLREKLAHAGRTIGIAGAILPAWPRLDTDESPAQRLEHVSQRIAAWRHTSDYAAPHRDGDGRCPIAAAVRAERRCALALVHDGTRLELVGSLDGGPLANDPRHVLAAIDLTNGDDTVLPPPDLDAALALVRDWITSRSARRASGAELPIHAPARRHAIRRIAAITAHTPHHSRPTLAPLAARARQAVTAPYGIGAERVLGELACAPMPDEAWLRALGTFADLNATRPAPANEIRLVALLVGVSPA